MIKVDRRTITKNSGLFAIVVILLLIPLLLIARETKYHNVNRLHEEMEDAGAQGIAEWPWGWGYQNNLDQKGHWIAVKNFTDVDGNSHPYYVAEGGTYFQSQNEYNIPEYIRKYRRYGYPKVVVDGEETSQQYTESDGYFTDLNTMADEAIVSRWRTGAGVTITRRSYAWPEKPYQDFIVMDYWLENTGEMNDVDGVDQTQTLEDVYFAFQAQLHPGARGEDAYPISNSSERDGWAEYYGSEPGDSLKILYGWDGKSTARGGEMYDPQQGDGYILAPQYIGFGVVHVDRSPQDHSNWADMPNSVRWRGYGSTPSHAGGFTDGQMYQYISGGTIQRQSQDPDPTTYPIKHALMSFGPFTMDPGDSVHIVLVEAVGGVSQALCKSVGKQWITNEITTQEMYDIIGTGLDSLHNEVSMAEWVYNQDYQIPEAPPSPDLTVTSGAGKVTLEWSDVSNAVDPVTGVNDFAGYRIYRQVGTSDSTYSMIKEISGSDTRTYVDTDVKRGVAYYYYVTAFDDGTQNSLNPGVKLESSKFTNRTDIAAHPVRVPETEVSKIRVIPNPYNYYSTNLYRGERDKVLFVNLPAIATIRIFTLSGDLVRTIEHTDLSGDEPWDLVTSQNQLVRSGVYVYHIEGEDESGNDVGSKIGKLVIVR